MVVKIKNQRETAIWVSLFFVERYLFFISILKILARMGAKNFGECSIITFIYVSFLHFVRLLRSLKDLNP